MNEFDEWRVFYGLDITRLVANLSKDEFYVKDLVDMLSYFILQVA
jgi:hypothetical protein